MKTGVLPTDNLLTDLYDLREYYFNESKNVNLKFLQEGVNKAIQQDDYSLDMKYLLFKLTNYCNSNCVYCPHARYRKVPEEKFITPHSLVLKTIEDAAELGVQGISLSGGEPLLRDDIIDIIKKVIDCKMIPVLLTNGLLLETCWDELGAAGLRYIIISVDSIDREIYEKQRGASFDMAMAGIEAAQKLRAKYGRTEIHVSAVLTKDNLIDFFDLVTYMQERDIKVQVIPYHKRQNDAENFSVKEEETINELVSRLIDIKMDSGMIANSVDFLKQIPDYFIKGNKVPENYVCKVGYTTLLIDANMDVKICGSYRFEPLGNLSNNSLPEIWTSNQIKEYRKRMLKCECEGCWYLCTSEISMMLD